MNCKIKCLPLFKTYSFAYGLCFFLLFVEAEAQTKFISFDDPRIHYEGRIKKLNNAAELSWSGSSITINFKGSSISAILKDSDTANYYNVIIDDKYISKIHTDTIRKSYILADKLPKAKHKVQLFKRTEWGMGKTWFYGFETSETTTILPKGIPPSRKLEFYGNSITCGMALEDTSSNDSGHGYFENNYLSYAAITARHFQAQYSCIAKSGIGVMVSWFPLIMPEMYDRLDPSDSLSKWDFSQYTPNIVVVNLFQNDSWIVGMSDYKEFKHRFGSKAPDADFIINSYKTFIKQLRGKYRNAHIICVLGNMDATKEGAPWPGYIQSAVKQLDDSKLYTHFFEYKQTDGHPKAVEQKAMAQSLIAFIDKYIW